MQAAISFRTSQSPLLATHSLMEVQHISDTEGPESQGQDMEAVRALRAIDLSPRSFDAHLRLGKVLLFRGDPSRSLTHLRRALKLGPETADLHAIVAQAQLELGKLNEAEAHLIRALDLEPAHATALAMLAYRLQTRGKFADARRLFERSILSEPQQSVSYYGLVQGRTLTSDDGDLVSRIAAALKRDGLESRDEMVLNYALGKACEDLSELENAMRAFDHANELAFNLSLGFRPFRREVYSQVLDRVIRAFPTEVIKRSRKLGLSSRKPIFIVGMMRSGTTLVEQILSSHPQVAAGGERNYWLDNWARAVGARGDALDENAVRMLASGYLESLAMVDAPQPHSADRVTDKMPQNFQVLGLMHLCFPNAPIIHVSRDPRDNCVSIYTTAYDVSPEFAHDRESIAFAYREYQRVMAHWRKVIPKDRLLEVSYEELVAKPENVVRSVVEFCGLKWDDACLAHQLNERVVHTPSLWQVRQPVYASSVGRWRRFEPWMREFGP